MSFDSNVEGVSMTRYYALVLVPAAADTPQERSCEAAAKLLYPYMRSENDPGDDYRFD